MEKLKSLILFLLVFIIFNDTLVAEYFGLFFIRIIYALFLLFFSIDIINNLRSLRGLTKICIFSFVVLLITSSFIHFFSISDYPYENIYNMIIIAGIVLAINNDKENQIVKYILISVLFSTIYAVLRPDTISEWTFRKTGGTGDPNEFACHLILASIIAWNYIENKVIKSFILLFFIFATILSGSVTGGLIYILIIFYKIISNLKNKFSLKSLIISFSVIISAYLFIIRIDLLGLYINRALNNSMNFISRQNAWTNGLYLFRENWYTFLIGGGPNYFDQRNSLIVSSNEDIALAAHNMYIEILADTGLIGMILFLCPVGYLIFKNIFNRKYDMFFAMLFMSLALSMSYEKYFWLVIALIL